MLNVICSTVVIIEDLLMSLGYEKAPVEESKTTAKLPFDLEVDLRTLPE